MEQTSKSASDSGATTVVYVALVGNILVALTKIVAAVLTGSAGMASEAIHSVVDTGDELLLIYGIHRSRGAPDETHPFGYGRELYFWSFIVALLVFALGAVFSIGEGIGHILKPEPIQSSVISYAVLALAFLFEGSTWLFSLRKFRAAKGRLSFYQAFRLSKDPPTFMVLFEDTAALIGILIAALGTFASGALHRPELDGVASVAIGLLLAGTSLLLARESKSLLIGEQAYPSVRDSILKIACAEPRILNANGLITLQLAPDQIVAFLSLEFDDAMRAPEIEAQVLALEHKVCAAQPQVVSLFIKPQTQKTYEARSDQRFAAADRAAAHHA